MAEMVVAVPSETVTTGVTVVGLPVLSTVTHASVASARAFSAAGGVGARAGMAVAAPKSSEAAASSFEEVIIFFCD